jgi:uncharacterized protein
MQSLRYIGLLSDTHGLLREKVVQALRGVDLILHAGDVGDQAILQRLKTIAPVVAVRGNIDIASWAKELPLTAVVEAGSANFYILHNVHDLDLNPKAAGFDWVLSGHSHKPAHHERDGVHYVNPGSAGLRRFDLPISLARLDLAVTPWKVKFIELSE